VLLATAALFVRSLGHASSIDIGFKPGNILMLSMDPKLQKYSPEQTAQFLSELRRRVTGLPGVRSMSFVGTVPLSLDRPATISTWIPPAATPNKPNSPR
jgi:hypothetical protein